MQATLGFANTLDGFDAGARAARQALREMGRAHPAIGILVSSHAYPLDQVVAGACSALGETPLWGFESSAQLHHQGVSQHGVLLALLSDPGMSARAGWWPGFDENSRACTQEMLKALQPGAHPDGALLLAPDGLSGDSAEMCALLPCGDHPIAGALVGGELHHAGAYQAGGQQAGSGGLAAARLEGVKIGVGAAHGWHSAGAYTRITQVLGMRVPTLDDLPSAETYARYFGFTSGEWALPPLNQLARAYPLGLEAEDPASQRPLLLRSPLEIEPHGSLRMNASLPQDSLAHLMVASPDGCLQAARLAAQHALENMAGARPALALVLVDSAWQTVFAAQPGSEVSSLQAVLGRDLPLIGGYTVGQIACPACQPLPDLLNNHILLVLIGSTEQR